MSDHTAATHPNALSDAEWYRRQRRMDPDTKRDVEILPRETDQAYCVRHDREMEEIDARSFRVGDALYQLGDEYAVYSCDHCRVETMREEGKEYESAQYGVMMLTKIESWKEGKTDPDMFDKFEEVER